MTIVGARDSISLYDLSEAYDIAFDFRDLTSECDALDRIAQVYTGHPPSSFLDLACGPGYHGIEFARRGRRSVALDNSSSMLAYAAAKARRAGIEVTLVQSDMRDFELEEPVDLAFCGMSSFHHLLTNADIISHLRSVARNLAPGGIYVIEADHPRDVFNVGQSLKHDWGSTREGAVVRMRWGSPSDAFDPIDQVKQITVTVEWCSQQGATPVVEQFVIPYRQLTRQELELLVAASGVFRSVAWLGVLNVDIPLTNATTCLRMVAVLRKEIMTEH